MKETGRVVFITGEARSGSTLLPIVLGQPPQVTAAGELQKWPQHSGRPKPGDSDPDHQQYWAGVLSRYASAVGAFDFDQLDLLQRSFERLSRFTVTFLRRFSRERFQAYCRHRSALFAAIRSTAGTYVLVSSRAMGPALMLARCRGSEWRVIHLVRDPRGVYNSVRKTGLEQRAKLLWKFVLDHWVLAIYALLVREELGRGRAMRMRYEALVLHPTRATRTIGKSLSLDLSELAELLETSQEISVPHLLDGNWIRNLPAAVLQPDLAWRNRLSLAVSRAVWLLTAPINLAYGYPIR